MNIREKIANELHRAVRKRYPTRKTVLKGIDDLYQTDLVEMIPYARENAGYRYILTVINCFTKFAFAVPVKTKRADDIAAVLEPILATHKMRNLQTDQGTEFYNTTVQKLLKKHDINHYSTYSDKKAAIVERFNRTLKTKMWKAFTAQGTHKWLDLLPKLVHTYNHTGHRSIGGLKPVQVTRKNETKVKDLLNPKISTRDLTKRKFRVGDKVRISKAKKAFAKGYLPNWTNEIFVVHKIQRTVPITYVLKDSTGELLKGGFYAQELAKSAIGDVYLVEKIVRRKGDKYLVKWQGFDKTHNSWIDKKDLV